jgi:hypothetical protein
MSLTSPVIEVAFFSAFDVPWRKGPCEPHLGLFSVDRGAKPAVGCLAAGGLLPLGYRQGDH